jgi:formate dehydrogenase iron-sulfur subunit
MVCPFGAIIPSYDGRTMVKCDLCIERLAEGEEPACVASCPMEAMEFVDAEEYAQGKRKDAAKRCIEQADAQ